MTPDEPSPSWDEHADELHGQQLALMMLRALLNPDESALDTAIDALHERIRHAAETDDYGPLESYQAAQAKLAIDFGRAHYGRWLDAVLERMQRELADHIAAYEPDDR